MDFEDVEDYGLLLGQDHKYYMEYKAKVLSEIFAGYFGKTAGLRILDLGCGAGEIECILQNTATIGIDASKRMIKQAKSKCLNCRLLLGDATHAPFKDGLFDAIFSFCLIHHIPPESWKKYYLCAERLLRPGGLLVIAEHNPLNPVTLYKARHPLDKDARLLGTWHIKRDIKGTSLKIVEKRNILFFPPALGKKLFWLEKSLRKIPVGGQYICVMAKNDAQKS